MKRKPLKIVFNILIWSIILNQSLYSQGVVVTGELRQYHKTTLTVNALNLSEAPETYLNYRMNVTITSPSLEPLVVPAYFAADGNASETSAISGTKWHCHFVPKEIGSYSYLVSFRQGTNIAVSLRPSDGSLVTPTDGYSGTFDVRATDKIGTDFRAKGKLQYVNKPVAQFDNGDYYFEVGADSPETFLEYADFDATEARHDYAEVASNFVDGDPSWDGGKGTEIIGAVNYLANQGMNVHYFLFNNITGDGNRAYPFPDRASYTTYDVSKLDQWQIVFDHMYNKGIAIEMVLSETENSNWFEDQEGIAVINFSNSRKLYYREMIARFGYLNVFFNIGEEANWDTGGDEFTPELIEEAAIYIQALSPYNDLITVHNGDSTDYSVFDNLVNLYGTTALTVASFQGNYDSFRHGNNRIRLLRRRVLNTDNKEWVVRYTEPYHHSEFDLETWTNLSLWASISAGASGVHYYSYNGDITEDNYTLYEPFYQRMKYAKDFIEENEIPIWNMYNMRNRLDNNDDMSLLTDEAGYYLVYLSNGGTTAIDIQEAGHTYTIKWFNPRTGEALQDGTITTISSGDNVSIGSAPNNGDLSWVVLIKKVPIAVTEISVMPKTAQIPINETTQIYTFIEPVNATNTNLDWTSSNSAIASVDNNGLVTGLSEGTASITATVNGSILNDTSLVTVPAESISSNNPQYEEKSGVLVIEAENIYNTKSWSVKAEDAHTGYTGNGYIEWGISENFTEPGSGLIAVKIKINNTGVYLVRLHSRIGIGELATEDNDSWLRFPDATINFATKDGFDGTDRIYPLGSDSGPFPEGSGKDNWWKVYTNTLRWSWQTRTSDNDNHDIYVQFDTPGVYTLEISGRSRHHLIDRILLNKEDAIANRDRLTFSESAMIPVEGISITPNDSSITIPINGIVNLIGNISPTNASDTSITWSSSNSSIASVNSTTGEVTGIALGTATITATSNYGGYAENKAIVVSTTLKDNTYNNTEINFKIYPNPTASSNGFYITGLDQDLYMVKIYDMLGKLINEKQVEFKNKVKKLNIPSLKPGIYFITVRGNNSFKSTRLIIK